MYALQIECACFRETLGEKCQQAAFREGDVRPPGRNVGFSKACTFDLQ
jgi:hypothetical protein